MKILTTKTYLERLAHAADDAYAAGQSNARKRALNARDHGYADGFAAGRATGLSAIERALEHALTNVEAEHQDTTVEHAAAVTRWEKRRLAGRLEALEVVSSRLTAQLEELRAS